MFTKDTPEFPVEAGPALVLGDGLAGGEVEFAAELHDEKIAVGGSLVCGLRFDDGEHHVARDAQKAVGALAHAAHGTVALHDGAAIGERALLGNLLVAPARSVKLREDERAAGVGFGEHVKHYSCRLGTVPFMASESRNGPIAQGRHAENAEWRGGQCAPWMIRK